MRKLKYCPFCGSVRVDFLNDCYDNIEDTEYNMVVRCTNCGATSSFVERPRDDGGDLYPEYTDEYKDAEDLAISYWNRRVNEQVISEKFSSIVRKVLSKCKKYCNSIEADIDVEDIKELENKLDLFENIKNNSKDTDSTENKTEE